MPVSRPVWLLRPGHGATVARVGVAPQGRVSPVGSHSVYVSQVGGEGEHV